VVLGDNIFEEDIQAFVENFRQQDGGARVFLKEVSNEEAKRFGCAVVDGDKVSYVEEKPLQPKSNLAMTGLYIFDSEIFKIISTLNPSARGEFEITDAIGAYVKNGKCKYDIVRGFWSDTGTFESLQRTSTFIHNKRTGTNTGDRVTEDINKFKEELDTLKRKLDERFL